LLKTISKNYFLKAAFENTIQDHQVIATQGHFEQ
jgi:hypothetical protein|tara:strand:+ start:634 stop:735 length:102 start_codon:yes stop_codon:yes gene_type:complete